MCTAPAAEKKGPGLRLRVQRFGTFLSSMIMPNIGAFIAWGLITALFIPKGFFPNEHIATLVDPMVFYLLPILIAFSGGNLIYGHRGGVVGAVSAMGVILGTSSPVFIGEDGSGTPMFLGAMIMGPLGAWCMKKLDGLWDGKIRPGFEMLVNNFSAGIFAAITAVASMFLLTPVMRAFMTAAAAAVDFLVSHGLLPLTALLIEPAKVLFLNNAINHGILTPLASEQVLSQGKSILYLLESNPGPGLGVLLAYCFFGRGSARATAPGAAIIHFLGGIHEIYFPYVLMKPQLILAPIAGSMTAISLEVAFNVGLVGPAAPGSILAISAMTASDSYLGMGLGVVAGTAVSFLVAAVTLKATKQGEDDLAQATADMEAMKGKRSSVAGALSGGSEGSEGGAPKISKIVFACDAGMGSSAMGASVLRNKIKDAGFGQQVSVVNSAINNLRDNYDLVVVHQDLLDRAQAPTPSAAHVSVDNFMGSPRYDEIVELIREQRDESPSAGSEAAAALSASSEPEQAEAEVDASILTADRVLLDAPAVSRDEAIDRAGGMLVDSGSVTPEYVESMHEREDSVSTFMGSSLAIPHGTNEAKGQIRASAMSFIRYAEPIDWGGKPARFVIGIAGAGGEHLELLQRIAKTFSSPAMVEQLEAAQTPEEILAIFGKDQ